MIDKCNMIVYNKVKGVDNNLKLWKKVVIICISTILLLVFPPTRSIIIFILPLGSGIDDLIVFILIAIVLLVLFWKVLTIGTINIAIKILSIISMDEEIINMLKEFKNKI